MASDPRTTGPEAAKVDFLVDERGSRIDVPDDSSLRVATRAEQQVGNTGPAGWRQLGLIALGLVALVLLIFQLIGGGPARTDVVPGTPVTPPSTAATPTPEA
jgi:hypothetical protein